MPRASDLKRGSLVELSGAPHAVEEVQIQTPSARGGASLYKLRFRNLLTKQKEDRSVKGDVLFPEATLEKRHVQFSYVHQDRYVFMDLADYNEYTVDGEAISEQAPYLTEELEGIDALVQDGLILAIELPPVVELEITQCDPSMRGASATARTKPATVSTGLIVQVPEYLAPGETIRIDTRSATFLSRA